MNEGTDNYNFVGKPDKVQETVSDERSKEKLNERDDKETPRMHDLLEISRREHEADTDERKRGGGAGYVFDARGNNNRELGVGKEDNHA